MKNSSVTIKCLACGKKNKLRMHIWHGEQQRGLRLPYGWLMRSRTSSVDDTDGNADYQIVCSEECAKKL